MHKAHPWPVGVTIFKRVCLSVPLNFQNQGKQKLTRQLSSMIHSARSTVSPVVNIPFTMFCFASFEMWGRTDGQHVLKQSSLPAVTVTWPSGSILTTGKIYIGPGQVDH